MNYSDYLLLCDKLGLPTSMADKKDNAEYRMFKAIIERIEGLEQVSKILSNRINALEYRN